MKKAILHRSIFAVVACIALAASVLLTSVKVTPVVMAEDVKALVGAEAETAFCQFHEDLQVWYQEMPVTGDGVTLTLEGGYASLLEVISGLNPYVTACGAVTDEAGATRLNEYNEPISVILMVALNLMMNVSAEGSYTFTVDEWTEMGTIINTLVSAYQG